MWKGTGARKNYGAWKQQSVKFGPWDVVGWEVVRNDEIGERRSQLLKPRLGIGFVHAKQVADFQKGNNMIRFA